MARLAKKKATAISALMLSIALSTTCLFCTACSSSTTNNDPVFSQYDDTRIAATVNGIAISEGEITRVIELMRYQDNASYSDLAWAQVLSTAGLTPETLRVKIINQYVQDELVIQECNRLGIMADNDAIDKQIKEARANFSTESEWIRALYRSGYYSEDAYHFLLEMSDLNDRLKQQVALNISPNAEEAAGYISQNAYKYSGKRSSCILIVGTANMSFNDMKNTAQDILDRINAGTLSFEDAATKYSADKSSSSAKGDCGWSSLGEVPDAYQSTLESLSVGQVSDLVPCSYGIYIIKCTDEFSLSKGTSVSADSVPSDIRTALWNDYVSEKKSLLYTQYVNVLAAQALITINDMPEGLSYDVNMDILKPPTAPSPPVVTEEVLSPREKDYTEISPITEEGITGSSDTASVS